MKVTQLIVLLCLLYGNCYADDNQYNRGPVLVGSNYSPQQDDPNMPLLWMAPQNVQPNGETITDVYFVNGKQYIISHKQYRGYTR